MSFAIVITAMLLVTFSSCLLQEAAAWQLIDHCMCKDVDPNTGLPISRTNSFTSTDKQAVCWFDFDIRDLGATISITRMWYDPSNVLYTTVTSSVAGGSDWYIWSWIYISGYPAAGKLGVWHVDVYANGGPFQNTKLFTETFTIVGPTAPTQTYQVTVSVSGFPSTLSANLWVDDKLSGTIAGGASKTFTFTSGTSHKFAVDEYVNATTGTRYYCSANTWTTSSEGTHQFGYNAQYYLTINSAYGSPNGAGWYDSGSTATFSITPSALDQGNGTRRLFVSWTGDSTATTPSASIVMDKPKTVTANWKKQYSLTVNSPYGSPTGSGWYDVMATAQFGVTSPVDHGNATRRVFTGWGGDSTATTPSASIIMDAPKTVKANWKTQYQLAVTSAFGSLTGAGWYDPGSTATFSITPSALDQGNGTRRLFVSWGGDIAATTPSSSIVINSPKKVTANWKKQYSLTVNSPYGSPTGSGWYDADASATVSVASSQPIEGLMGTLGGKYVFQGWSGDSTAATPTATIKMNTPKTVTATWTTDLTMPYAVIGGIVVVIAAAIGIVVIKMRKKAPVVPPLPAPQYPLPPALPRKTKYCVNCGAEIPIVATYCTECGAKQ